MDLLESLLEVASEAARVGGRLAEQRRGRGEGYFSWKGSRDPFVSQSLDVQNAMVAVIREHYPDAAILAEEGPEDEPLPMEADPLWVIDPICGSMNYMHDDPEYAVGLAVRVSEMWEIGVVYEPARDLLYTAIGGRGARRNGKPIAVDQFGDGTEAINRAVVGVDFPGEVGPRSEMLNVTSTLLQTVLSIRAIGSPALALCKVACGQLHGYVSQGLQPWDILPGTVILQEAGGVITNYNGASWLHTADGGYVASNAIIQGRLLQATLVVLTLRDMSDERIAMMAARAKLTPPTADND